MYSLLRTAIILAAVVERVCAVAELIGRGFCACFAGPIGLCIKFVKWVKAQWEKFCDFLDEPRPEDLSTLNHYERPRAEMRILLNTIFVLPVKYFKEAGFFWGVVGLFTMVVRLLAKHHAVLVSLGQALGAVYLVKSLK